MIVEANVIVFAVGLGCSFMQKRLILIGLNRDHFPDHQV